MARRRYFRYYPRTRVAKKKWASNFTTSSLTINTGSSQTHAENVLVTNSTQTASPTPVIVKTGNFKIQGDCYITVPQGNVGRGLTITLYIMYLPEVVVAQANVITTIQDHPEWIMGWKMLDYNFANATTSDTSSFTFSSRLKRNLNSGDAIALVAIVENGTGETVVIRAKSQYWTCAN